VSELPGVFGVVEPYLTDYGYAAVFLIVLLENLGLPVPGEGVLVTGTIFATAGRLDLTGVVVAAFAAAVLGDNLGYAVGRLGGRPMVLRVGRRVRITGEHLDRVEGFFARHGSKLVVVARFLPLLRHLNGIAAGVSRMAWRRFLLANTAGAAIWVAVWATIGSRLGAHLETVNTVLETATPYIAGGLVTALVALVLRRRRRSPLTGSTP
jgi:membrane protein DedA with SNARE-associated domain